MRKIKFRAWVEWDDGQPGAMWYDVGFDMTTVYLYEQNWTKLIHPPEVASIGRDCDGLVVEQFTGLHDKNGKDVYENDIVKCTRGCPHQVIFILDHGGNVLGGMPTFYLSGLNAGYQWCGTEEVIGNIHENPELLKETK